MPRDTRLCLLWVLFQLTRAVMPMGNVSAEDYESQFVGIRCLRRLVTSGRAQLYDGRGTRPIHS